MPLNKSQLRELPSSFYRVAVKALIFDAKNRLAVVINDTGKAELPGGGWEHGESFEACLQRELDEEMSAQVRSISPIQFSYRGVSKHGWQALRLVVRAELVSIEQLRPKDPEIRAVRFVTQAEFMALECDPADKNMQHYAATIWNEKKE